MTGAAPAFLGWFAAVLIAGWRLRPAPERIRALAPGAPPGAGTRRRPSAAA